MGLGKGRSRWEIILELLNIISHEKKSKKTRIMQKACLDWKNFNKYLDFLIEDDFIIKEMEGGNYELTDKGGKLLDRLKEVDKMFNN